MAASKAEKVIFNVTHSEPDNVHQSLTRVMAMTLGVGVSFYALCIAAVSYIAPWQGLLGKRFATAMTKTDGGAAAGCSSLVRKLGRESARLASHFSSLGGWVYQKALLRVETTTVGLE